MKHIYKITAVVAVVFLACNKSIQDDKLFIRGRLFLTDSINQSVSDLPLGGKKVMLFDSPHDSLNFLYSRITDAAGYFNFELMESQKDKEFTAIFDDISGGFRYIAKRAKITKGQDTIRLFAQLDTSKLNGFFITITDTLNPPGYLPRASVRLYNSLFLANLNDSTGAGAVDTFMADNFGKVKKLKLPAGNYYLNIYKKVDTVFFERKAWKIIVPLSGFVRESIQVRPR